MRRKNPYQQITRDKLLYYAGEWRLESASKALAECQRIEALGHTATIEYNGGSDFQVTDATTGEQWSSWMERMLQGR